MHLSVDVLRKVLQAAQARAERAGAVAVDVKHLARDRCYDEWSTWCGAYQTGCVEEPEQATCLECLSAARDYGEACVVRKCELLDAKARRCSA